MSELIAKLNWRHQGILDWLLANPHRQLGECAKELGYSLPWISRVISSDLFQSELARRRLGLVAVQNVQISERLHKIADKGLELIERELNDPTVARPFDATELALKALGYMGKGASPATQNNITINQQNNQQNVFQVDAESMREAQAILQKNAGRQMLPPPEKGE